METRSSSPRGKPPGGTYSWKTNPTAILGVSGSGEKATVKGDDFGRATVEIEYRTPDGKTKSGTLSGSVAGVRSVNGGATMPRIGLKDENGKDAPPLRVPLDQVPPEGDLLSFPVADEGIATVVNEGENLLIQGLRVGRTTTQAQTQCREKTGPVVNLEVVRCTQETIDKMLEKEQEVLDRFNEKAREAQEIVTEPELKEVEEQIWKHTGNALLKASEVVLTGASLAGHVAHAVHTLEHAVSMVNTGISGWSALQGNAEAMVATAALLNPLTSAMAVEYEVYEAWHEWLGDLAKINSTTDKVNELTQQCERDLEELDYLADRREKICGKGTTDTETLPSTSPSTSTDPPQQPQNAEDQQPAPESPSTAEQPPDSPGETPEPPIIGDPSFRPNPHRAAGS